MLLVGTAAWLGIVGGGGYWLARHDAHPRYNPVPELRFAGADMIYVLRRVASEAGLPLALDEVRPLVGAEDLRMKWVDADLRAGPLEQVLTALRTEVGGFDYALRHGILYVRSREKLEADTRLDIKDIPGGTFEGDLKGLGKWILQIRPGTFLNVHLERGHPVGPNVRMHVPPSSSVLDVLLLYAKESGVGWWMRRAGQVVEQSTTRTVVVGTDIQPWKPLPRPRNTAPIRQEGSSLQGIARVARRTKTPFCVIDATPGFGRRGTLDLGPGEDPELSLRESMNVFASIGSPPILRWEQKEDGIVVVRVEGLDRFPALGEILSEPLAGGYFRGSLPELARWINRQIAETSERRLRAGEIVSGLPTATLVVEPGASLEEVLLAFASEARASWYLAIADRLTPRAPTPRWRGAFLSNLLDWAETAHPY